MIGLASPVPSVLPNPDGSFVEQDRYQLMYQYGGFPNRQREVDLTQLDTYMVRELTQTTPLVSEMTLTASIVREMTQEQPIVRELNLNAKALRELTQ
jgi:hypothetical protein